MKLDLSDEERHTLLRLVRDALDATRYPALTERRGVRTKSHASDGARRFPFHGVLPDGRASPWSVPMQTAKFLRHKARQCRKLLAIATVPEVCAQLELWARDFDDEAVKAELTRRPS
jgi:hypothetical protein